MDSKRRLKKSYVGYSHYTRAFLANIDEHARLNREAKIATDQIIHSILATYAQAGDDLNRTHGTQTLKPETIMALNQILIPKHANMINMTLDQQMIDYRKQQRAISLKRSQAAKARASMRKRV